MDNYTTICRARVTAVHRERYEVRTEPEGDVRYARLKQGAYHELPAIQYPTVGDYVDLNRIDNGDSLILTTHPRAAYFSRKQALIDVEQAVAANFDEVFILVSLNNDFNVRRVERYASQAWQSGGTPVVILTKCDLIKDARLQIHEINRIAPGVDVYAVSALTGEGMDAVSARLTQGKTVVLMGSSGVGKSSLVNALMQQEVMAVREIREDDARGRHTTTYRQMIILPCGASIIDTPGMRELGLWDAAEGVREAFDDIYALAASCRFSDCAHGAEPGCAVKQAVEAGKLDPKRLHNYQRLKREAQRRTKIEAVKRSKSVRT